MATYSPGNNKYDSQYHRDNVDTRDNEHDKAKQKSLDDVSLHRVGVTKIGQWIMQR